MTSSESSSRGDNAAAAVTVTTEEARGEGGVTVAATRPPPPNTDGPAAVMAIAADGSTPASGAFDHSEERTSGDRGVDGGFGDIGHGLSFGKYGKY